MLKRIFFLFIIIILMISCRRAVTRPVLDSLGTPPEEPDSPVIDENPETPEKDYIIKASDSEDVIETKIKNYYEKNQEYVALIEDTKENIEANNTIETLNSILNKDTYSKGILLDLSRTDITEIKENAFKDNANLVSILFPNTLTTIGNYAFNNCKKLETINFPSSLTTIGIAAFHTCSSLKEVNLKDTMLKIINAQTFYNCSKLATISFPDSLWGLDNSAFTYCSSLEEITFPVNFEVIGNSVFSGCISLKKVNFNEKLKSIYHYAFYGCSSLSSISLPSSLEKLGVTGPDIFSECTSLLNVEYLGTDSAAIICIGNVFGTSNPQNLYLPNVEAPTDPVQDPNTWENFLGYNWANKIQYNTPMPKN